MDIIKKKRIQYLLTYSNICLFSFWISIIYSTYFCMCYYKYRFPFSSENDRKNFDARGNYRLHIYRQNFLKSWWWQKQKNSVPGP